MSTSTPVSDARVKTVTFDHEFLHVEMVDGLRVSAPLAWYPRLAGATADQLSHWTLIGGGYGIHWEAVDEHLSAEGLILQQPAPGVRITQR